MAAILKDRDIRQAFQQYHTKRFPTCALLQELRVLNGIAVADIVSVGQKLHCYEIKSDTDQLDRALKQSKSYDLSFNKITLITTQYHLRRALKILPAYWGIISVEIGPNVPVRYIRAAKPSPLFSTQQALKLLWKDELLDCVMEREHNNSFKKLNRADLIKLVDAVLTKFEVINLITTSLMARSSKYQKIDWLRNPHPYC